MVPGPFAPEVFVPYPYTTALGAPHPGRSQVRRIEVKLLRDEVSAGRSPGADTPESERQRGLSNRSSMFRGDFHVSINCSAVVASN